MNDKQIVAISVILAAVLVACSVGAAVISNNSSSNSGSNDQIDFATASDSNKHRAVGAIVVGGSDDALGAFIPPRHPDNYANDVYGEVIPSRPAGSVGTSELQMLLSSFCPDTSVNFVDYMIDNVLYEGKELTSFVDVMKALKASNFQFYRLCILTDNNGVVPLSQITVEDFICHAVYEDEDDDPESQIQLIIPKFWLK